MKIFRCARCLEDADWDEVKKIKVKVKNKRKPIQVYVCTRCYKEFYEDDFPKKTKEVKND